MHSLEKLFGPESIAILGASNRKGSVGFSLMSNLVASGYRGVVYPVNPKRKSVLGIRCYKSLAEVPEQVDLAIVATPSFIVPKVVEECVNAGAKSLIVVSSGFGEIGEEGRKLELELGRIIRGTGTRLLGPNCLGYIRTDKRINASFAIRNALPGKMALISQSGALCSGILDWAQKQNVGFKYFISVGSMLDINFADLIEFIGEDKEVESIAIYMESIKDSEEFMKAAKKFSLKSPIIVAKSGRFEESAKAAVSHTGSMAGNDEVFEAAFEKAGIVRVENVQELLGSAQALAKQPLPKGNRLAVITNAGGPGVMATDAVIRNKCRLARLSKKAMERLEKEMPSHWSRSNPIDLLGDAGPELYEKALNVVLGEKGVDGVVVILSPQAISKPVEVARAVAEKAKKPGKTVLACWLGEGFVEQGREVLRKNCVPCYRTPEEAVRVFSYMESYRKNLEILRGERDLEVLGTQKRPVKAKRVLNTYLKKGLKVVSEIDSKKVLESYGIPVNRTVAAKGLREAVEKAREIGFPVVLKVLSPDITHKTEVGGVALNLISEKEVASAFRRIVSKAKRKKPKANILGVSVQKMVARGKAELILGKKEDRIFGPVVVFGAGGIAAEVFGDKSIGLPPITKKQARRIVHKTKISKLFSGRKARVKADLGELEGIISSFSRLALDFPEVEEIDINPLILSNGKFFAVDARIVLKG